MRKPNAAARRGQEEKLTKGDDGPYGTLSHTFWRSEVASKLTAQQRLLYCFFRSYPSPMATMAGVFRLEDEQHDALMVGLTVAEYREALGALEGFGLVVRVENWLWVVHEFMGKANNSKNRTGAYRILTFGPPALKRAFWKKYRRGEA